MGSMRPLSAHIIVNPPNQTVAPRAQKHDGRGRGNNQVLYVGQLTVRIVQVADD